MPPTHSSPGTPSGAGLPESMVPVAIVVLEALPLHSLPIMHLPADVRATFTQETSIRTVFSMPTLGAMAGEIERRIHENVATMSEFEAEQLAEPTPVAGA